MEYLCPREWMLAPTEISTHSTLPNDTCSDSCPVAEFLGPMAKTKPTFWGLEDKHSGHESTQILDYKSSHSSHLVDWLTFAIEFCYSQVVNVSPIAAVMQGCKRRHTSAPTQQSITNVTIPCRAALLPGYVRQLAFLHDSL